MRSIMETERLKLYEFTVDDAPFLFRLVNDPSWLRYIGDRKVYSVEDAEQYLLNNNIKSYRELGFGFWKVVSKESGEPMGSAGLGKRPYLDDVDLGFAFLPEYVGKGYAYEASKAIIRHAAENFAIHKLVAFTTKTNHASIRLLQKLGFEYDRILDLEGEELNLYSLRL